MNSLSYVHHSHVTLRRDELPDSLVQRAILVATTSDEGVWVVETSAAVRVYFCFDRAPGAYTLRVSTTADFALSTPGEKLLPTEDTVLVEICEIMDRRMAEYAQVKLSAEDRSYLMYVQVQRYRSKK